jgi:hypothetical protein
MNDGGGQTERAYADSFLGSIPQLQFASGAQWMVSKENIRSKTKKYYDMLWSKMQTHMVGNYDGIYNAWNMEGMWNYIFDPNVQEIPQN